MKECQVCKQCFPDVVTTCPQDNQPTFHSIAGDPILEGKYKLEKRLGQGGMGVVYQAKHNYLKTSHAIKVILPDLVGNDPQLVTRFRQEALAAAAIRHQNVVSVTDYGVVGETLPFLVMEFVEGESLQDLLAREKRLSPERAVELMSAICAGVGAAHRQGIVHRDLKPLNVMILKEAHSMSEAVKILDFGLAKIKSGELLGSFIQAQTTGLMGSPYYMAPEQWADEDPEAQADVYSLGVMMFQMLIGDVPFKGSSIPAIMKKHLSDPPPAFADYGVTVVPELEEAIRRTLEKDKGKRTSTVQEFADELKLAVGSTTQSMHLSGPGALPVSTIHILTKPPESSVFVDSVPVGESRNDGWLLIDGIQSGNHRLRVSKDGFIDWESQVICDGKPLQVVAQLQTSEGEFVDPGQTMHLEKSELQDTPINISVTQGARTAGQKAAAAQQASGQISHGASQAISQQMAASQPGIAEKKSGLSPMILAISGILGLLLLTGIGGVAAWKLGFLGSTVAGNTNAGTNSNTLPGNSNSGTNTENPVKAEMIAIPGGSFTMGNKDGPPEEKPEHEVQVKNFMMDKTEVTNAEYFEFVKQTSHRFPAHWSGGKPVAGEEMFPVVRVDLDDVNAFIAWRSKRDSVQYRLPTEEEWEYAARNGSAENQYPWGNNWEKGFAVIEMPNPVTVGSMTKGNNKQGISDLIGNVWEWTSTEVSVYPGSPFELKKKGKEFIIRGGSYNSVSGGNKGITATSRVWVDEKKQDGLLGFRLVRSN